MSGLRFWLLVAIGLIALSELLAAWQRVGMNQFNYGEHHEPWLAWCAIVPGIAALVCAWRERKK
jgi:hypothetical protein